MSDEFPTVLNTDNLGGKGPILSEAKLSQEAITAMMQGPNQMGPGMHKDKTGEAQTAQAPTIGQP